jgi:hypothetical protein
MVAGLTVTLVVVAATLLIPRLRPMASGLFGRPDCPPPPAGLNPEGAPFDPLVRPATIGFFPEPMTHRLTRTSQDLFEVSYTWRDIGMSRLPVATELDLRLWRPGAAPWLADGASPDAHGRVDPIHGGEAVWLPQAGLLRWEVKPRMWAELGLRQTLVNADLQPAQSFPQPPLPVVRRVAESVSTETAEPLRLPWRLPATPAGLTPVSAQVVEDPQQAQPWRAELVFGVEGERCSAALIISSASVPGQGPGDGFTVTVSTQGNGATLTATGGDARHDIFAAVPEAEIGPSGVRGFFDRMEIFGEPSTWKGGTLTGR